jgi:hydroxymethylpyrimidine/phosphomethylpyrimidine kinase
VVALTAQNTRGVRSVHLVPSRMVTEQLDALAEDLPPAAVKTGMLATADLVTLVADTIAGRGWSRYVCDPVMVASSGDRLLDSTAESVVRDRLVPLAAIVTPNLAEAEVLTGLDVRSEAGMEAAGQRLLGLGARAALVKGGHLETEVMTDLLVTPDGMRRFAHARLRTASTHGTGCTLSAAITAGLAQGRRLDDAVADAVDFVHRAMLAAPALGSGHGPLNHMVPARAV